MLKKRKLSKQLLIFINAVLLISALFVIIALFLENSKYQHLQSIINVLYSLASSLIASVIVVYSSTKLNGEPVEEFQKKTEKYLKSLSTVSGSAIETGFVNIFNSRSLGQEIYFKLLQNDWKRLDIMGIKVEFLGRDARFENALFNACTRNASVRILLLDISDEKKLIQREKYEAQPGFKEKALIAISSYQNIIKSILDRNISIIPEIRFHDEYLPISLVRIDDDILFYFRLRNQTGSSCPLFHFKKTNNFDPFESYTSEFERLWNKYKT